MTQEKHKAQRSETHQIEGRIAFCWLHEKRTKDASGKPLDNPRYQLSFLVPKLHTDPMQCPNYQRLAGMSVEAATKAWGQFPQGGFWPIEDGDVPKVPKLQPGKAPLTPEQIATRNSWRVGSWIIEMGTYNDPGPRVCVMQNGQIVEIPAKVINGQAMYKSGDYGFVSCNAYTFHNETFGVKFGFEGVLFTRPGEPIGSSGPRSAAQMFGGIGVMASPPSGQPPIPGHAAAPAPVMAPTHAAPQMPVAPSVAAPAPAYAAPQMPVAAAPAPVMAPVPAHAAPLPAGMPPVPPLPSAR